MWEQKNLYAVLGAVGALALLLVGMSGASIVSAQEVTPEPENAPDERVWNWGRVLFGSGRGGDWTMFDTVADELGLTPEALFAQMHDGRSVEEIAEDQGVDLNAIQEALSAARDEAMRDAIEQAVEDGEMSEDEAGWLLEGLENGWMRGRGLDRGFGRGPGMRGGFDGFGPGGIAPQSESSDTRAPASRGSLSL